MKLITRNICGSLVITNISNKSSIKTTKAEHIIEIKKDGIEFRHEIRSIATLISDTGNKIATWDGKDWFYG